MRFQRPAVNSPLWLLAMAACLSTTPVQAALVDAGNGLIEDTGHQLTWTQDANLFKTMYTSTPDLISRITGVMSTYTDSAYGMLTIADSTAGDGIDDFDTSTGRMSWWGAQAWVTYLNDIRYGGVTGWRLPTTTDMGAAGCNFAYGGTDCGYNVATNSSELAHVFHEQLGNRSAYTTTGSFQGGMPGVNSGVTESGPFSNLQNYAYWSDTEYARDAYRGWFFGFSDGSQFTTYKSSRFNAWAVYSAPVAEVPVPAAVWLMGSALSGLLGWCHRKAIAVTG